MKRYYIYISTVQPDTSVSSTYNKRIYWFNVNAYTLYYGYSNEWTRSTVYSTQPVKTVLDNILTQSMRVAAIIGEGG